MVAGPARQASLGWVEAGTKRLAGAHRVAVGHIVRAAGPTGMPATPPGTLVLPASARPPSMRRPVYHAPSESPPAGDERADLEQRRAGEPQPGAKSLEGWSEADASERPLNRLVPPEATGLRKRRILVVDDYRDSAESLAAVLRSTGSIVETAYEGQEALRKAEAGKPDVIILDIGLPDTDGYAVCRTMRQRPWGKDVVIVAMSGLGSAEDGRESRRAGFDRHFVKPLNVSALMNWLRERTNAEKQ